jgi:hypothetical protein
VTVIDSKSGSALNFVERPSKLANGIPERSFWSVRPAAGNAPATTFLILAAATLAAGGMRYWGIQFGLPHTECRPDETPLVAIALQFFRNDFNPHFFDWPTLFMYVVHAIYRLTYYAGRLTGAFGSLDDFTRWWTKDPGPLYLIPRYVSALLGVATVPLVFSVARRLFDRTTALLAAWFLALSFLHVRDSHFGVTDVPVTFLIVSAFSMIGKAYASPTRGAAVAAGVLAGLATATKYNAALIVAPMVVVLALRPGESTRSDGSPAAVLQAGVRHRSSAAVWRDGILFTAALIGAFIVASPYALLDHRAFMTAALFDLHHLGGGHGVNLGRGLTYHLTFSLWHGLGWPLLISALAGIIVLTVMNFRQALIVCAFPVVYYLIIGSGYTVFVRYMDPVVPFLCITAAVFVRTAAAWLSAASRLPSQIPVSAVLAALVVTPSAVNIVRLDRLLAKTDNRLIAGAWMDAHVAPGESIYQTGSGWGQLQLTAQDRRSSDESEFNPLTQRFALRNRPADIPPDWIVVQESPVRVYTRVPWQLRDVIDHQYDLTTRFIGMDTRAWANKFDQQDAFFVPFAGFERIARPGPNFFIYRRKPLTSVP